MYYNSKISYNNLTYSVDMIRLKTYIDYDIYSNIDFYLNTFHKDKIEQYWISDKIMNFKYNFHIKIEEGKSFFVSFHHNNENVDLLHHGLHNLTIEFNPNKLKDSVIIRHILGLSGDWYIKSFDLAVDLPVNILDIIYDKGRKRKFKMFSYGGDNITYMIGEGDMRTKIYNKKRESNLDIAGDLTRIEISRVLDDFPVSDIKLYHYGVDYFPEIYMNDYIYSLTDIKDKTMLPIIYAVQNGYPLNELSRRYKDKLKALFENGQKIKFTDKDATEVIRKTIFSYFMKNERVKWR